MSQQKRSLIVKISSSLRTAIFDCVKLTNERLFNVNCQAQLGETSQWHQSSTQFLHVQQNMLGHTAVG